MSCFLFYYKQLQVNHRRGKQLQEPLYMYKHIDCFYISRNTLDPCASGPVILFRENDTCG